MVDRRTFLATTGAFAAGLAGCLGRGAGDADHDIGMSSSAFLPAEYRVEPGTTVTWKNTSTHAHTVTAYENTLPDGTDTSLPAVTRPNRGPATRGTRAVAARSTPAKRSHIPSNSPAAIRTSVFPTSRATWPASSSSVMSRKQMTDRRSLQPKPKQKRRYSSTSTLVSSSSATSSGWASSVVFWISTRRSG